MDNSKINFEGKATSEEIKNKLPEAGADVEIE